MALPKRRHSKSRRNKRRAHGHLSVPVLAICSHCNQPKLPHHICPHCGYYDNKQVLKPPEEDKK